jgi:O-acetyl-ADP-ribose deacetylase (regulator of RNase III)
MDNRTADYRLNNSILRVTYGDITNLRADALVSSDDNHLTMGGGVSYSILRAGGQSIREEARKHIPLKLGDVAVTSAGELPAKYIFHAVTIDYTEMQGPTEDSIRAATLKCMQLGDTLGINSIALPALGTGVGKFPFQLAAEVIIRTIAEYLLGDTRVEFVTITLFAREGVRQSDLNLFYERAVALASVSAQSKRLDVLIFELERIVNQMDMPLLSKRVNELHAEIRHARETLAEKPDGLEHWEEIQEKSQISEISKRVVEVSSDTQESTVWTDKELEAKVLRTKLEGILTQLNIQIGHRNRFEIEKAKYGGIGVPPRLETAIQEINQEVIVLEAQEKEVRETLAKLMSQ